VKLPSIDRLAEAARAAAVRFPFIIACAVVAAVAAIIAIDADEQSRWVRLTACATLGFPLFFAIGLRAERFGWAGAREIAALAVGFGVLAAFYWRWGGWSDDTAALRYFHFNAGLHFLVAVSAHLGFREPNGFWQFNRALFLRFLLGAVYSAALFSGLAIALAGVDNLLGVSISGESYFRLWIVIAFVFNTWFFAAGVPRDVAALDRLREYPAGLRAFAQYVLLPLVGVYLVILSAYLVRVLVTRVWPSGWIGYLVSALAALGILSLLLVHPERERSEHAWIDRYARFFWVAILPAVVMLLMAIWQRVGQYGITERRYLLVALALWLAAIAVYYAVSGSRSIKAIPASLAAIAFITFIGPWSAYATSRSSQLGRLRGLLETNGILVDGSIRRGAADVGREDAREITATLRYLVRYHGTRAIDPWYEGGISTVDTVGDGTGPSERYEAGLRADLIIRDLGIEPVDGPREDGEFRYYQAVGADQVRDIAGYDFALVDVDLVASRHIVGADTVELAVDPEDRRFDISRNGRRVLGVGLDSLLAAADDARSPDYGRDASSIPRDALRLDVSGDGIRVRLYVDYLTTRETAGGVKVENARGQLYVRFVDTP